MTRVYTTCHFSQLFGHGDLNQKINNQFLCEAQEMRSLVKSAYQKNIFLISQPKHMLWVLKRTVSNKRNGSVVECLTGIRGAASSSLTVVTALWFLSKTHLSQLSTSSTQEDPSLFNRPCLTERLLMGRKESNQTIQNQHLYTGYFGKQ